MKLVFKILILLLSSYVLLFANDDVALYDISQKLGPTIPRAMLKKISINLDKAPMEDALALISDKIDLQFNFNRNIIPVKKRVSVKMDQVFAAEALLAVLEETGTSLMITDNGHMVIMPQGKKKSRGAIKGIVRDAVTGEVLPGANVMIKGTSFGAATNIDGEFKIQNLPPGNFTVFAKFIGYDEQEQDVQLSLGEQREIEFDLSFIVVEGAEVVVTAQAEGQMAAINQQLASRQIVNVVSSDRIQEMPDANAAESVGRLPGVSINRDGGEATSVTIRGLSEGFNTVSIDGVKVPSASDSRSVGLDFISPNMLDGIVLTKALTADMEGDATGGNVNFVLKDAPSGLKVQVDLQGGYSGLRDEFGMPKGNLSVSNRFFDEKLGIYAQVSAREDDRSTDYFGSSYQHSSQYIFDQPGEPKLTSINLYNVNSIKDRYGVTLVMDYRLPNGKLIFKNFGSQLNTDVITRRIVASPTGGSDALDFRHNYVKSETRNISNSFGGEHQLLNGMFDWKLSSSNTKYSTPTDWTVRFASGYASYLGSTNDLNKPPDQIYDLFTWDLDKVRWNTTTHEWTETEAKEYGAEFNYERPWQFTSNLSGNVKFGGKYRYHDRAKDYEIWTTDTRAGGGHEGQLKRIRDEIFSDKELTLVDGLYVAYSNFIDESLQVSDLLKKYNFLAYSDHDDMKRIAEYYYGSPDSPTPSYMKESITADYSDYSSNSAYSAGYVMTEINFGRKWTLIPGVRYESVEHDIDANYIDYRGVYNISKENQGVLEILNATPSNDFWLPMVHLQYQITDWCDIRLASTKTLRRPNYLQYSPQLRITTENILRGNPNLKVETSQNFDVQASFYNNLLGLLSVGGFYKEIDNYIYSVTTNIRKGDLFDGLPDEDFVAYSPDDFAGYTLTQPINNEPTAYVRGIEMEWQTRFWYLPKPFDGLVLNTNISFIDTETRYPQFIETGGTPPWYRDRVDSLVYRKSRMQNQPEIVGNVSVGYDKGGFSGRLSFYYQGNTLAYVDRIFTIQDYYKDEVIRLDLKLKQKLSKNFDLFFDLNNLTNDPDIVRYNIVDYLQKEEHYDWQASLGLRYTL